MLAIKGMWANMIVDENTNEIIGVISETQKSDIHGLFSKCNQQDNHPFQPHEYESRLQTLLHKFANANPVT